MNLSQRISQFLSNTTSKSPMVSIKSEKELYADILNATSYLRTAKMPQRIHHINTSHYVAVCSICMKPVEWYDGSYRITCCRSCSLKQQNIDYLKLYNSENDTLYANVSQIPSVKAKKEKNSLEKYGVSNVSKAQQVKDIIQERAIKRHVTMTANERDQWIGSIKDSGCVESMRETYKSKTGYETPFHNPNVIANCARTRKLWDVDKKIEVYDKILDSRETNGFININTPEKEKYYQDVWRYSNLYYNEYKAIIDPENKRNINGGCRLDHVYSIFQGYRDGISPEIIGHYSNLQVIDEEVNRLKGSSCGKSKDQLMEDFQQNKFNQPNYKGR